MLTLSQIESDLTAALKRRDMLAANTLRGLKVRIQNEQISKLTASSGKELSEAEILVLVRSELKRRKEAAAGFTSGNNLAAAEKEEAEGLILASYLPAQMSESDLSALIEKAIADNGFTAADFGRAMGKLKAQTGDTADGALMAKLLKEHLK